MSYKKFPLIIFLISISFFSRAIAIYFFGDTNLDYEWGIIISNLETSNIFAFRTVDGVAVPNIFMPPLYPFFLYIIKIITNDSNYFVQIILFLQVLFSLYYIFIFYKLTLKFFSAKLSYLISLVFSLLPIHIYATSQISSASIHLGFLIIYFYYFLNFVDNETRANLFLFSLFSAILILLRGEFIAFHIFTLSYYYFTKKKIKYLFLSFLITLIVISPYLIRNYKIFGVVAIAKAEGYDLWKGNNPNSSVEGYAIIQNKNLQMKINELKPTKDYDLKIDRLFKEQALEYIIENPFRYLKLYFKKAAAFLFVNTNSSYPNYYNPLHIIPKLILGITTLIGVFLVRKNESFFSYLSLYYFFSIALFSVFFILPRYSLSLIPIQLLLSAHILKKMKPNL